MSATISIKMARCQRKAFHLHAKTSESGRIKDSSRSYAPLASPESGDRVFNPSMSIRPYPR